MTYPPLESNEESESVMPAYLLLFSTFLKFTSVTSVGCCASFFLLKPTEGKEKKVEILERLHENHILTLHS